ncbi:MAG: hypothetical protein HKN87_03025 [Saprospiraceae bacterium]|nr:hypothetical protein [Saprospiraceae bacterium]
MRYIILLVALCSSPLLFAQALDVPEKEELPKGRQYRFPDFQSGTLALVTGREIPAELNYNLVTEEIVVQINDVRAPYPTIHLVAKASIADASFIVLEKKVYEILHQGSDLLLAKRKQIVTQIGQQTGLGRTANQNDLRAETRLQDTPMVYELEIPSNYILRDVNLYFLYKNGQLLPLRNFKKLAKLYAEEVDLKSFLREQKLNSDTEEDLVKAFKYCMQN